MFNGMKLKEIREAHNMTQKEAAKLFNISYQALSNYERGTRIPNNEFLMQFAKHFNLMKEELLDLVFDTSVGDGLTPYKTPTKTSETFTILTPSQISELSYSELMKIKEYAEMIYAKHRRK